MNVTEAETVLGELAASTAGARIEVGTTGRPPHNFAYLRLTSTANPTDHVVVSTPGDGWFQLEVAGGFYTGQTSDLTPDEWVREILEFYVGAGLAYLAGHRSNGRSRLFRVPFVTVQTDDGSNLRLRLPVREALKSVPRS